MCQITSSRLLLIIAVQEMLENTSLPPTQRHISRTMPGGRVSSCTIILCGRERMMPHVVLQNLFVSMQELVSWGSQVAGKLQMRQFEVFLDPGESAK